MEIITTYLSEDGYEFDTKEECEAHEMLFKNTDGIVGLDEFGHYLDMSEEEGFNRLYLLYIKTEEALNKYNELCDYFGFSMPVSEADNYYYFDERTESMEKIEDIIADMNYKLSLLKKYK